MLDKVEEFLVKFAAEEYNINRSAFDPSVSEEDHGISVDKFLNTYYTPFYVDLFFGSKASRSLEHIDEDVIKANLDSCLQRTVYLIRHYKQGRYGSGIKVKGSDRFDCFLGPDDANIDNGIYLENFSIANDANDDLKIVSIRTYFINRDGEEKTLDWGYEDRSLEKKEGVTILDDGELVDTLKLVEPEIPLWNAHYNSK